MATSLVVFMDVRFLVSTSHGTLSHAHASFLTALENRVFCDRLQVTYGPQGEGLARTGGAARPLGTSPLDGTPQNGAPSGTHPSSRRMVDDMAFFLNFASVCFPHDSPTLII